MLQTKGFKANNDKILFRNVVIQFKATPLLIRQMERCSDAEGNAIGTITREMWKDRVLEKRGIGWAMRMLEDGHRVRRSSWDTSAYLELYRDKDVEWPLLVDDSKKTYNLGLQDVLEKNWELSD